MISRAVRVLVDLLALGGAFLSNHAASRIGFPDGAVTELGRRAFVISGVVYLLALLLALLLDHLCYVYVPRGQGG